MPTNTDLGSILSAAIAGGYVAQLDPGTTYTVTQPIVINIDSTTTGPIGLDGNGATIVSDVTGGQPVIEIVVGGGEVDQRYLDLSNFNIAGNGAEGDGIKVLADGNDRWVYNWNINNVNVSKVGGYGLDMVGSIFEGLVSNSTFDNNGQGGVYFGDSAGGGVASALRFFGGGASNNNGPGITLGNAARDLSVDGASFADNAGAGIDAPGGITSVTQSSFTNNAGAGIAYQVYGDFDDNSFTNSGPQTNGISGYTLGVTTLAGNNSSGAPLVNLTGTGSLMQTGNTGSIVTASGMTTGGVGTDDEVGVTTSTGGVSVPSLASITAATVAGAASSPGTSGLDAVLQSAFKSGTVETVTSPTTYTVTQPIVINITSSAAAVGIDLGGARINSDDSGGSPVIEINIAAGVTVGTLSLSDFAIFGNGAEGDGIKIVSNGTGTTGLDIDNVDVEHTGGIGLDVVGNVTGNITDSWMNGNALGGARFANGPTGGDTSGLQWTGGGFRLNGVAGLILQNGVSDMNVSGVYFVENNGPGLDATSGIASVLGSGFENNTGGGAVVDGSSNFTNDLFFTYGPQITGVGGYLTSGQKVTITGPDDEYYGAGADPAILANLQGTGTLDVAGGGNVIAGPGITVTGGNPVVDPPNLATAFAGPAGTSGTGSGGSTSPSITAPAAQTIGAGKAAAIGGLSLAEANAPSGETFTVQLTDANGKLAATGTGVSGSGSIHLTVTGSMGQVNADLATLTDTDGAAGSDPIAVSATDSSGNSATPSSVAVMVNGSPAISAPASLALTVGIVTAVGGLGLAEAGNTSGETFTVTMSDARGELAASGPGVTGSGTTALTVTGTLGQVNAALATVSDTAPSAVADTISIAASDSLGNSATRSIADAVSGAPAISAPAALTLGIGRAAAVAGLVLAETGSTTGETFTVTLNDGTGNLSATGTGVTGSGTTALTIAGSLGQVNADLATVKDTDNSAGTDAVTVKASDSLGKNAAPQSIAVTTNGLPTLAARGSVTVSQGQETAIPGLGLGETGTTAGETFTVTLKDGSGALSATGAGVTGSGTIALTIAGSLGQVNADLATVSDTFAGAGSDSITVKASDSLGNSASALAIAVSDSGVPRLTARSSTTIAQGRATAIPGISLAETGSSAGETFTITLSDGYGHLTASGTGVSGSNTTALTIAGSLAQVNADLATVKDNDNSAGTDAIKLNASDSFGNNAATQSIAVTDNGPPKLSVHSTLSLTQGKAAAIPGLDLSETGNTAGETFTVTVKDGSGDLAATGTGVSGSGTTALTIAGSLGQVNGDLATVTDTDSVAATDMITVAASDSFGNSATAKSIAVKVSAGAAGGVTAGVTANMAMAGPATTDSEADGTAATPSQTVSAQLGQPAYASNGQSIASQEQTVNLPTGSAVTVNLNPAAVNPANPGTPGVTLANFNMNDMLDLLGIPFTANTVASFAESSKTSGVLTVSSAPGQTDAAITLLGQFAANAFVAESDGSHGTMIADAASPLGAATSLSPTLHAAAG